MEVAGPSEMNEVTAHTARAGDVRAQAAPGSLPSPNERRIFVVYILWCVMMWKERSWQYKVYQKVPGLFCNCFGERR
jgi:hypothetical protein